jgi:hypothetical protein
MTQPVTESMIRTVATQALRDADGPRVVAVHGPATWDGPLEVETEEGPVEVRPCVSVLAVREALSDLDGEEGRHLVILTPHDERELGSEVRSRLWRHRVHSPDSWGAAKDLFRADRMDPALGDHRWLVDLIVEAAPTRGYPPVPSGILDLDTAWKTLLRHVLRVDAERPTVTDLLRWGETDAARSALRRSVGEHLGEVAERLSRTAGPAAPHLLRLVKDGKGRDLVPLGLLCDLLWDESLPDDAAVTAARVRLEGPLGARGMTGEVARSWGQAAVRLVRRARELSQDDRRQGWVSRAEAILAAELDASVLAFASDVLPRGFDQRLAAAAAPLKAALESEAPEWAVLRSAVSAVGAHLRALDGEGADRCARLVMAERLVRRLHEAEKDGPGDLAEAARGFLVDGAWVDRAREVVSHGETIPELGAVYGEILERIDEFRAGRDRRFARALAGWSEVEPTGRAPLLPIERVLDEVVVPAATANPALLLVLDGWSHPEALRLERDLKEAGWIRQGPLEGEMPLVVSALPSITRVSRTSLLSGRLAEGTQEDERRNWSEHDGLRTLSRKGAPPLFHRRDLSVTEGQVASEVRRAILDRDQPLVGVVVNAVDEHLEKGGQLRLADGIQAIRPLRPLLDAAMEAGRTVILASDHGHVLEAGSEARQHGGAGERWRPNHPPAEEREVEIAGPRVLLDGGSIVVPETERIRYMSAKKRGYHGGATPQEVLCPLVIVTPPGVTFPGWGEWEPLAPAWWRLPRELSREDQEVEPEVRVRRPIGPAPVDPDGQGRLFGDPDEAAAEDSAPAWIQALLESPILAAQKEAAGRLALADEDLVRFLVTLDEAGGSLPLQALARAQETPVTRIRSKLAALRRMLNVDGYSVLSEEEGAVRLDRKRLILQFRLDA